MLRYLCSLAAGLGLCMGAHAAVVTSAYTALGGDAWSVRLGVQNDGTPGVITGFTVYFDAASYQGLSLRQGVAGWDTLVLPGDLALPADGFLDSAVLSPANALGLGAQASGWELDFRFSTPGALPGALAFDIVDSNFAVQASGRTTVTFVNPPTAVPEPGSAPLLAVALLAAALASARRRVTHGGSDGSPHLVLRRGARMGFATVALAAGLAGCGGGGQDPDTQAVASATAQKRALAASTALPSASSSVTVQAITQTAQRRIGRTVFEFDYRLTVKNSGGALLGVALELQSAGPGTTVVDGLALAGDLAAGATVQPGDTVTVRHDRSLPFAPDKLAWRVRVAEPVLQGTAAVGAALANANVSVTDSTRSNVCAESRIVSSGTGGFTCTVLAGKTAPFLVTVTEPFGAYPPMVSVVGSTPAPGTALVVNATPLTTALVAQLAPDQLATSVVANPALIDLAALASITRNVLAQIAPVLAAVDAPVGYDPFSTPIVAATPQQAGNTADQVIELLRFTVVAGVPQVSSVDNPAAGVPIAGANTVNPPVLATVSPAVLGLVDAMRTVTSAFQACFALPVASRVLAVDNTIAATSGGRLVTTMAPACSSIAHPAHLHNGFQFGQRFYGLLHDDAMVGASFSLPELMLLLDDTSAADNDRAVINIRYVDRNGNVGNLIEVLQKLPGTATPARPTDWWVYGNRDPVDSVVRAFVRRNEQLAPNPGTAPFVNASASRFETGIEIFINKDGPGSLGLRAARVKGPGLPTAGLIYTRPNPALVVSDQNWLNLRRKDGLTDPASATLASDVGNVFRLQRSQGLTGPASTTNQPNPNAGNTTNTFVNWAHPLDYGFPVNTPTTGYINFASLGAFNVYTFELYYDGETAPRHVLSKRTLTPVVPATYAVNLPWVSFTPAALNFLDPAHPLAAQQTSFELSWNANPFAETVGSAGLYTFGGGLSVNDALVNVSRGATRGTAVAPVGVPFRALTNDGSTGRTLQLRYRMLDGSYKDSTTRFN